MARGFSLLNLVLILLAAVVIIAGCNESTTLKTTEDLVPTTPEPNPASLTVSELSSTLAPIITSTPEPASTSNQTSTTTSDEKTTTAPSPVSTPTPEPTLFEVEHLAFHDYNGNGVQNIGEPPIEGIILTYQPGETSCITDKDGKSSVNITAGNYHVSYYGPFWKISIHIALRV